MKLDSDSCDSQPMRDLVDPVAASDILKDVTLTDWKDRIRESSVARYRLLQ